jgi:hypothetical protein
VYSGARLIFKLAQEAIAFKLPTDVAIFSGNYSGAYGSLWWMRKREQRNTRKAQKGKPSYNNNHALSHISRIS